MNESRAANPDGNAMTRRNILVVFNGYNTPPHTNDAGGAFIPEGVLFARRRIGRGDVVRRVSWDNRTPPKQRAKAFLALLAENLPQMPGGKIDAFVYLGHGLRNALSSAGITQKERPDFSRLLAKYARDNTLISTLYACSTSETTTHQADGEGGFADHHRDDLAELGIIGGHVDGHTIAAHCTQNAFARRFENGSQHRELGGEWIVDPKDEPAFKRWRERLHAKSADDSFRFDFPYMSLAEIRRACAPI